MLHVEAELAQVQANLVQAKRQCTLAANRRNSADRASVAFSTLLGEREEELASVKAELAAARVQVATLLEDKSTVAAQHCKAMRAAAKQHASELRASASELRASERGFNRERDEVLCAIEAEEARAAAADAETVAAKREAEEAKEEARLARDAVMEEAAALEAAREETSSAHYQISLLERKLQRSRDRAAKFIKVPPAASSADENATFSRETERVRRHRARAWLANVFELADLEISDVAWVLEKRGVVAKMFDTKPIFTEYVRRVRALCQVMQDGILGIGFGLYLHFDMHLTMDKILQINQAVMEYDKSADGFRRKIVLRNPYARHEYVKVPRIAPPRCQLEPRIREIEATIGVYTPAENGRIAFRSLTVVVQEMVARTRHPASGDMPQLASFLTGDLTFPLCFSVDATGFGKLQLSTAMVRDPYGTKSAAVANVFGIGNVDDGRNGCSRLFGSNRDVINRMIHVGREKECMQFDLPPEQSTAIDGPTAQRAEIIPEPLIINDLSALRHQEHIANSGICGCDRETALRVTPKKPTNVADMHEKLRRECLEHTYSQRVNWSHTPRAGTAVPDKCTLCDFGSNRSTIQEDYNQLLKTEAELAADTTKKGKSRFSDWRMAHAKCHHNIQPGLFGAPFLEHDMSHQIIDPLHLAQLNMPKIPWKHGLLVHASDDCRELISEKLKSWNHPLDCRRKDDNRVRAQKWFTGEAWCAFAAGYRGSPGAPVAIATLLLMVAEDMLIAGENDDAQAAENGGRGSAGSRGRGGGRGGGRAHGRGRGRAGFMERQRDSAIDNAATGPVIPAQTAQLAELAGAVREPSALERACDVADLEMIRNVYGSRAQVSSLLAFVPFFVLLSLSPVPPLVPPMPTTQPSFLMRRPLSTACWRGTPTWLGTTLTWRASPSDARWSCGSSGHSTTCARQSICTSASSASRLTTTRAFVRTLQSTRCVKSCDVHVLQASFFYQLPGACGQIPVNGMQ